MQIQLITESLTRLLNHSLHAPLTTLMLISPAGQLLASASPLKSSILRSRATLAMSIWELYCDNKNAIPAALPLVNEASQERGGKATEESKDNEDTNPEVPFPAAEENSQPIQAITLQLTLGILTIRLLSCGLLLIGLSDSTTPNAQNLPSSHPSALPSPATSHGASARNPVSNQGSLRGKGKLTVGSPPAHAEGLGSSAASDAGSTSTTTGRGRQVQALRRRTEMCARWLEDELVGYKVAEGI